MGRSAYNFLAMHTVEPNGCWRFTGKRKAKGYGLAGKARKPLEVVS